MRYPRRGSFQLGAIRVSWPAWAITNYPAFIHKEVPRPSAVGHRVRIPAKPAFGHTSRKAGDARSEHIAVLGPARQNAVNLFGALGASPAVRTKFGQRVCKTK